MAILKVARMGHPILRKKAAPLPDDVLGTEAFNSFLGDMLETMREYSGIGLAAPQVHTLTRVVVVYSPWTEESDEAGKPAILINPDIVDHSDTDVFDWEGCLSIPGIRGEVPRWEEIRVQAVSPSGETIEFDASGYPARVIQHEVDHLDGILFPDRMEGLERLAFTEEYSRFWEDTGPEDTES